ELQLLRSQVDVLSGVEIMRRIHVDFTGTELHPERDSITPTLADYCGAQPIAELLRNLSPWGASDQPERQYPVERLEILCDEDLGRIIPHDGARHRVRQAGLDGRDRR